MGYLIQVQKNCFTRCSQNFSSELPKLQYVREISYLITSSGPGTSSRTGVFLRDSSYGIWDYLKKLCFWELETKNRVTSLFEAYLKVPQVSRDYMCYICIS